MGVGLAVGAPGVAQGATQSFDLGSGPSRELAGVLIGDEAGSAVAGGFDVNGDGLDDVAIGAPEADPLARANAGEAYVVFGSASRAPLDLSGLTGAGAGFRIVGAAAGDQVGDPLGRSLAGAGDVNGDGFDDLLLGMYQANGSVGEAVLLFGPIANDIDLNGGPGSDGILISGAGGVDSAGFAVDGAGDVDGDGFDDLLVSAVRTSPGSPSRAQAGTVYVIFGSAAPNDLTLGDLDAAGTGFRVLGAQPNDLLGRSVAGAGDVNADGYADILVSSVPDGSAGKTYVIYGGPRGSLGDVDLLTASVVRFDGATGSMAGWSVDGAGDVNGDGYGDVVVGARKEAIGGLVDAGAAYVVFGGSAVTSGSLTSLVGSGRAIVAAGAYAVADTGYSVAGVGDAGGDGLSDVAVGAFFAEPGSPARTDAGAAYLVRGTRAPVDLSFVDLPAASGFEAIGAERDRAGPVAGAGDVDGDGFADFIVGTPGADPDGRGEAGAAYVVYGFGSSSLAYSAEIDGTVGAAVERLAPNVAGTGVASFAVIPALPAGLVLDTATGAISGTPTLAAAPTAHTVSMTDLAGVVTAQVRVTVRAGPDPDPVVVKPDNRFAIVKRKRAGRYVIVTRIRVPGPGVLTQATLRPRIVTRGKVKRKRLVAACRVRKRPAKAGVVTLRCRVNGPARRVLAKRRIRFTIRYAYTPVGGDRSQRTRMFTLRKAASASRRLSR